MSIWDVFISHASEDKQEVVKPIAEFMADLGAKVWYDEFTLELGDSLSRSIDKGLANSRFGLVVLSPDFLSKDWPEYELRGLVAKELGRDKVILPIWHNVTKDEVLSFSPPLADKLALKTDEHTPDEIGLRILGVVRPDLLEQIHARIAYQKAIANAETKTVDPKSIKVAPVRHEKLTDNLVGRVRLVRAALIFPYPQTMEFWLDGFKRDMHPHKEIEFWEHAAACYMEYVAINRLSPEQQKAAFSLILSVLNNAETEVCEKYSGLLPPDSLSLLIDSCRSKLPVYELHGLPSSLEEVMNLPDSEMDKLKEVYSPRNT
ncbi:MAG: hypothetical protein SRB1_03105 [Desulfobacteraceae bacterium Eth-SRB1]|nr:MAG: hypothetical protein SRB1_03105 [Desulfobacteraceae bacterium Eth-SRB1]